MSQVKNNEEITRHLQRIFIYGDEVAETGRVNSFLEFLTTTINTYTGKPYELGARSLYRYISGEQQFPVDLMKPLVSWSLDVDLMEAYNISPAPSDQERMEEKIAMEERELEERMERIRAMKGHLVVRRKKKGGSL